MLSFSLQVEPSLGQESEVVCQLVGETVFNRHSNGFETPRPASQAKCHSDQRFDEIAFEFLGSINLSLRGTPYGVRVVRNIPASFSLSLGYSSVIIFLSFFHFLVLHDRLSVHIIHLAWCRRELEHPVQDNRITGKTGTDLLPRILLWVERSGRGYSCSLARVAAHRSGRGKEGARRKPATSKSAPPTCPSSVTDGDFQSCAPSSMCGWCGFGDS